jgi:hypothetical protein
VYKHALQFDIMSSVEHPNSPSSPTEAADINTDDVQWESMLDATEAVYWPCGDYSSADMMEYWPHSCDTSPSQLMVGEEEEEHIPPVYTVSVSVHTRG